MKLLEALQNPYALVAQGFVAGALLFFAAKADTLEARPAPAPAQAQASIIIP